MVGRRSFPFGARPIFWGELLVSGMVYCYHIHCYHTSDPVKFKTPQGEHFWRYHSGRCWSWWSQWKEGPVLHRRKRWGLKKNKIYIYIYIDLTRPGPPNDGLLREFSLFRGNLGWWNIIIWPDKWYRMVWVLRLCWIYISNYLHISPWFCIFFER